MKLSRKQIHFAVLPAVVAGMFFLANLRAAGETAGDAVIASGGKSGYVIALPDEAADAEKLAAEEIQSHLEQLTGAKLEIVTEKSAGGKTAILIGATRRGAAIIGAEELKGLGGEGFILREKAGDVAITGAAPRGTLFGAYSLLEDRLGVRWFAPDTTFIPKKEAVDLTGLDDRQVPSFEYREPYFYSETDGKWAARNRLRIRSLPVGEDNAANISYAGGFVHTLQSLIPADKYFKDHPEYFSEVQGERIPDGQTCLTSEGALKVATERVLELAESTHGRPAIISVSQNDNFRRCTCPKCLAVDKEEGSPAGTMLRFVNSVADAAAKKYPNVAIDTLAYQYTEKVPLITKPRPNVIVRLCHMAPSCEVHPLGKCFWNKGYINNLKAWSRISNRLYVWDYVVDFSHYAMPFPNLDAVIGDIPFHYRYNVRGMFQQGDPAPGADLGMLKAWVIAKLLWNQAADGEALVNEFLAGYYGPAAPAMRKYIDSQLTHVRKIKVPVNLYSAPTAGHLDARVMEEIGTALDEAEKLAAGSPLYAEHIREARLSYTYVQLAAPELFAKPPSKEERLKILDAFKLELEHFGVSNLAELESTDATLARFRKRLTE